MPVTESESLLIDFQDTHNQKVFLETVDWICRVYSPLLIAAGCISSLLSFIVFSRRAFGHSTMSIYLRVLSVSDIGALLSSPLLERAFDIDMRFNDAACRSSIMAATVFVYLGHWILVILSGERALSVFWPHRVQELCTHSAAKKFVLGAVAVSCIIAALHLPIYGVSETYDVVLNITKKTECRDVYASEEVSLAVWIYDSVVLSLTPCAAIIVCNAIIVYGVRRSSERFLVPTAIANRNGMTIQTANEKAEVQESQNGAAMKCTDNLEFSSLSTVNCVDNSENFSENSFVRGEPAPHDERPKTGNTKPIRMNKRQRKEASLIRTLITINTAFLVCNLPISVNGFVHFIDPTTQHSTYAPSVRNLLSLLMFTNSGLNFVLYAVTGSKFRAELVLLFRGSTNLPSMSSF